MSTKTTETDCIYYIVQHGEGYSVDTGVETDFKLIFPKVETNNEIIRFVPPSWVMMSNDMVNNGIRNLLKNNVTDENFWNMWKTQFSRNRKGRNTQKAALSETKIGTTAMNQMPILAETLQLFGINQRYYNEILRHENSSDFGIWRFCDGEDEWECIFDNKSLNKLFSNYRSLFDLIFNNGNSSNPKDYSIQELIVVLNDIQKSENITGKTRFIFGSCSPLQTQDRNMRVVRNEHNKLTRYQDNSSNDPNYWFRKLKYFYYRVKLFFEGKAKAKENIANANNINNLQHPDLGEELLIAENDERKDIYIQFHSFFTHLKTWTDQGKVFTFPDGSVVSPKDAIKYLLRSFMDTIYNNGISPDYNLLPNSDKKITGIFNNLTKNHEHDHPGIFDELMTQMGVPSSTARSNSRSRGRRGRSRGRSREKSSNRGNRAKSNSRGSKSRSRSRSRDSRGSRSRGSRGRSSRGRSRDSRGRSNRGRGRSNRGRGRRGGGRRRKISKRRKRLTRRRKRLTRRSGRP